ncbi:MAG: hypothetical protein V1720_02830 [bacterium]
MFGIKNLRNIIAVVFIFVAVIFVPHTANEYILLDIILINLFLGILSIEFARFISLSRTENNGILYSSLFSVLCGFLIFMNNLFFIQLIIIFLFIYRYDLKRAGILILIGIVAAAIIYVIVEYPALSFSYFRNFYSVPVWVVIILTVLSILAGWMVSDLHELFFTIGFLIFAAFLILFFSGDEQTEYFTVCIPYLIASLQRYKVDKFLGKVLEKN